MGLDVSGGWRWLLFEYFTARTGQDRTLPGAMGEGGRNEDKSGDDMMTGMKLRPETKVLISADFVTAFTPSSHRYISIKH